MHHLLGARRVAGVLSVLLLSACSSGGGDSETGSTHTSVSANSVAFTVDAPDAATPAPQTITATFGENVAHLAVIHTGVGVANVSSTVSGKTAQITIEPEPPSTLGSGIFRGVIAVTGYFCADSACSSLAAGNTQEISVNYQISPVILSVAPYIGTANVAGTAIIRGIGFASFATAGVRFGTTPATEFVLFSDQEIRANYPALPAGSYDVQIDVPAHQGAIQTQARFVVVDPVAYPAQTLAYPAASPTIREVLYDAGRRAIVLATDTNGGTLTRFAYSGTAWDAPSTTAIGDLQDVALSTRGDRLLALTRAALVPVDPATLAAGTAIAAPSLTDGAFLKDVAVTNDDRALITTGRSESALSPLYLYSGRQGTLNQITATTFNNGALAAAAAGSSIVITQGHSSLTSGLAMYVFLTSAGDVNATGVSINQGAIAPVVDRSGTRVIVNGTNVYGANFALLGTLPAGAVAVAIKPDGTRAYTYNPSAGILTFDISADAAGQPYAQLGSTVAVAGDPGANPKMTISADGGTLFLAGSTQLVIQPTPAQ